MGSPFIIPLAVFAMVVLIVAIVKMAHLRDKEMEFRQRLHSAELEHRREMQKLELELQSLKQGG